MNPSERESAADDLQRQREVLRRNFVRANTAVAVILFALLALAVAAVIASLRARRSQELAEAASHERQAQLADSLRTQARAVRLSGQAGRRFEGLLAISNAAALGTSAALRNEAIACFALSDLATESLWPQAADAIAVAFDPALKRYAVTPDGRHITLTETSTDATPRALDLSEVSGGADRSFLGLGFSPQGRYLATRLYGGGAVVWEVDSGRIAFNYSTNGIYETGGMPCFTHDERWLVFPELRWGTNLLRADLNSGHVEVLPVPISPWQPFRVDPEGHRVAIGNQSVIEIWNLATGQRERQWSENSRIVSLAWSGAGRKLAAGGGNGDVSIWDVESGMERQLNGHTATPLALEFSPDDERLCSAAFDGTLRLWEVNSGRPLLTMEGQAVKFGADGERLGFYQRGAGVGVWRLAHGLGRQLLRPTDGRPGDGWKSDLSPDGRWLALVQPMSLLVWDLTTSKPPVTLPITNLYTVFWHPSETTLFLVTDGHIETRALSPAPTETSDAPLIGPARPLNLPPDFYPAIAAISADARTLAMVAFDGIMMVGDPARTNGFVRVAKLANPSGPLGSGSLTGSGRLAVSPDGQWVATVDMARTPAPHIFEARTGKLVKVLPTLAAAVGFSPDGRWLATCGKADFALWAVGPWTQVWRRPRSGLPSVEGGVAFSGDGALLAVTKSQHAVALLERASGEELAEFTPPDWSSEAGLRMSADAQRIVVPTLSGQVQVWDVKTIRRALATLGLDWGSSPAAAVSKPVRHAIGWASPTGAVLFGLVCVTPAAFFALGALRRHRGLLQQFVRSEAEAQRRSRELEVAKIELMHSQKMQALGTLAAGIAHDFNNLLSVIRMSNKLIGRATKNQAEVAEEVADIEEAVQQGKQVVSSMLGYSRQPDDGEGRCDLDEVVEETLSLLSREFLSGIELTLALDRNAPPVSAGRGRIEQILLNLVVNAAEAMKTRGKLEIAVRRAPPGAEGSFVLRPRAPGALVELRVADSGPGIAPDILPRIFEPFFTTKKAGTKQGTGLGLSMVYTIAEQEGFGIAVDSLPGGGATFRILLPACAPEAQFPEAGVAAKRKAS